MTNSPHFQTYVDSISAGLVAVFVFLVSEQFLQTIGLLLGIVLLVVRIWIAIKELKDRKKSRNRRAEDRKSDVF